jgi:hypothetical protein
MILLRVATIYGVFPSAADCGRVCGGVVAPPMPFSFTSFSAIIASFQLVRARYEPLRLTLQGVNYLRCWEFKRFLRFRGSLSLKVNIFNNGKGDITLNNPPDKMKAKCVNINDMV